MSRYAEWNQQKVRADYMKIMSKEHNHIFHASSRPPPPVYSAKPQIPAIVLRVTGSRLVATRLNTEEEWKPPLLGFSGGSRIHCDKKTPICMK